MYLHNAFYFECIGYEFKLLQQCANYVDFPIIFFPELSKKQISMHVELGIFPLKCQYSAN